MREAIGGTWLFQIVIAFILLFTAYICLSINHTKAFNVKNEIINTIERDEGVDLSQGSDTEETIKKISNYLKQASYRTTGDCPTGYTAYNRDGEKDEHNAAFCILKQATAASDDMPDMSYYRVMVFYQLDLPIFNQVFNFKVTGDTKKLNNSFKTGYYRIGSGSMCQMYREGKKVGPPMNCSSVTGPIMEG